MPLISSAYAQAAGSPGGGGMEMIVVLGVMFVIMYFLTIRPQQKRAKEHRAMIDALQKGDEVLAAGGIAGRVSKVDDGYIALEIAQGVEIRVQKASVQLLLPKGTLKS